MANGQQLLQFSILLANGEWPTASSILHSSSQWRMAKGLQLLQFFILMSLVVFPLFSEV
jgi:hypothetical protein